MTVASPTLGLLAASGALAIDQATKALAVLYAARLSGGVELLPGANLVFLRNDGVSFGLLGQLPWWALSGAALAMTGWLLHRLFRSDSRREAVAYGLVVGGALGNVLDRVRFGAVTDFLDLYVGRLHWPAFNLADVAVVCGIALLLVSTRASSRAARTS